MASTGSMSVSTAASTQASMMAWPLSSRSVSSCGADTRMPCAASRLYSADSDTMFWIWRSWPGGIAAAQHAELAAAAGGAAEMVAVDHQAAAERGGDQDVEERLVLLAEPELHLAHGGGGGVVLDEHRHVQRVA